MFLPRPIFQIIAFAAALTTLLVWLSSSFGAFSQPVSRSYFNYGSYEPPSFPYMTQPNLDIDEPTLDPIWDIRNRTLGFQKIYAISMPHRTDKRDYLALMGLVSGIEIEFMDGVNGSEMHPKAFPSFWKGNVAMGDFGTWRAHLNVYRHMLQNRIETALILEDDVDWDIFLRAQLLDFARGVRCIQIASLPLGSPYGDNWDLLALDHIGANNKPNKVQKYWITENDPTVIAEARRTWSRKPDFSAPSLKARGTDGEHTRVVMEISKFTGAAAYGISLRGAARLLYDQAVLPNAQAIDVAMLNMCRHDTYKVLFCLGAYPMIFGRYRAIGPQSKDSDRHTQSNDADPGSGGFQNAEGRRVPESEFTVFPVSLNMGKILAGQTVFPANDPGRDLLKEVDMKSFVLPRGKEVVARPEEYVGRESRKGDEKVGVKDVKQKRP